MKNIFCSLALSAFALAWAPYAAANEGAIVSCSVGPLFDNAVWYGDVELGQYLIIQPGTLEVNVTSKGSLIPSDGTWSFGVTSNANPGYPPRTVGLVTPDIVVFGRGTVIYMEPQKNLRIDCQLKE